MTVTVQLQWCIKEVTKGVSLPLKIIQKPPSWL